MRLRLVGGVLGAALVASGCSVSFPIAGLSSKAEDEIATTSSILPARGGAKPGALASLSADLGPEDMRRADGAMALALDPQGNGAAVNWDNPQSGIKGAFTPVGGPFLRSDEICRAFIANVQTQSRAVRLHGTACRPSGGEWAVREVEPWKGVS